MLGLLKPHLTDENYRELLAGVSGTSVREAKEWLAARFPQPDVPSSIRRCPEKPEHEAMPVPSSRDSGCRSEAPAMTRIEIPPAELRSLPAPPAPATLTSGPAIISTELAIPRLDGSSLSVPSAPTAPPPGRVEPLSRDRFVVKLTVSREAKEKIELARDLMRHQNPRGDLAVIVERALDALLSELKRAKLGQTKRQQGKPRPVQTARITSGTRRVVVARDGLRCSFVSPDGRRCETRAFLEFDHQVSKARGGSSEASNVRLLCRAHNLLAAECAYGAELMQRRLLEARTKKTTTDMGSDAGRGAAFRRCTHGGAADPPAASNRDES